MLLSVTVSAQIQTDVIETCSIPVGHRSAVYSLEVMVDQSWVASDVATHSRTSTTSNYFQGQQPSAHWATLGLTHSARVKLTRLTPPQGQTSQQFSTTQTVFQCLPGRYVVDAKTTGLHTLEFTIKQGQKVYVRTDNQQFDTFYLFANPPKPSSAGANVDYWGPGEHTLPSNYSLPSGKDTLYLDRGAWVRGTVNVTASNGFSQLRIVGPGVLSGELDSWEAVSNLTWPGPVFHSMVYCDPAASPQHSFSMDGPTVVASPMYTFFLQSMSGQKTFSNTHVISPWTYNTDAFNVGSRANISDCFAFNNDDTIHGEYVNLPYNGTYYDLNVSRCVFAGRHPFLIGYGYFTQSASNKYATISSCDVVLDLNGAWFSPFNAMIDGRPPQNGNPTVQITNQVYRDIKIYGNVYRLFNLRNVDTSWGWDDGTDPLPCGNLKTCVFENIELLGTQQQKSILRGSDYGTDTRGDMGYLEFRNLVINGVRVTNANQWQYFDIDWATVSVNFR